MNDRVDELLLGWCIFNILLHLFTHSIGKTFCSLFSLALLLEYIWLNIVNFTSTAQMSFSFKSITRNLRRFVQLLN